jgi:hypothetical protein
MTDRLKALHVFNWKHRTIAEQSGDRSFFAATHFAHRDGWIYELNGLIESPLMGPEFKMPA